MSQFMKNGRLLAVAAASLIAGAAAVEASQQTLIHRNRIFLTDVFNDTSGYGDWPISVAFDGANAYVGGWKATAESPDTLGVARVSDLFNLGNATVTPLPDTIVPGAGVNRGIDGLAWDSSTNSLIMSHDSGNAATSFISRRNADGSEVWMVNSPFNLRPVALAVDPVGDGSGPGVAFLAQGNGRQLMLNLADGSAVYTPSGGANPGPLILVADDEPFPWGFAYRALAFDSAGNIAITEDSGWQYGQRVSPSQYQSLGGVTDRTSGPVQRRLETEVNLVGQGVAILEGLGQDGSDLLAFTGRGIDQVRALGDGSITDVDQTNVHIRNIDGTTTGLSQITLTGDEGEFSSTWLNNAKNLAFGIMPDGSAVLLIVDMVERRLDVYQTAVEIPLLPGDANRDGRVDGEDFLIWQASFGIQQGATWDDGDFNGDGRVDGEDFLIWQAHFGSVAASSAVTPEPGVLGAVMALGSLLMLRRRH